LRLLVAAGIARHSLRKRAKSKNAALVLRKADRADHIFRVSAEIMCQKGYEATSMNDIADAVGLTKAGVYHYIRGKERLLFEIMSFGMDMVDEDVIVPARQVPDAELRLRTIVERHVKRILEVGGAVTILIEETQALTDAHRRNIRARKRAYFVLIRDTLEQLAGEGKLRDLDATVATFTLLGQINWISRWYRTGGRIPPAKITADLLEMALASVLKPAAC
jgi:AcrR family transcriptional regulator